MRRATSPLRSPWPPGGARRLAQLGAGGAAADAGHPACLDVTDASWWIEHRDVPDPDLPAPVDIPQTA